MKFSIFTVEKNLYILHEHVFVMKPTHSAITAFRQCYLYICFGQCFALSWYGHIVCTEINKTSHEQNESFSYAKTKAQISCGVTAQLIRASDQPLCSRYTVKSLSLLNLEFQASSICWRLYRPQGFFSITKLGPVSGTKFFPIG